MARVLSAGALRHYKTWADICSMRKPRGRAHLSLGYEDHCLDMPIFPRCYADGSVDERLTSKSLADHALPDAGYRTGFRESLTFHASRREALFKVDSKCGHCSRLAESWALTDQIMDIPSMNVCDSAHTAIKAPTRQRTNRRSARLTARPLFSNLSVKTNGSMSSSAGTLCIETTTIGRLCLNIEGSNLKSLGRLWLTRKQFRPWTNADGT